MTAKKNIIRKKLAKRLRTARFNAGFNTAKDFAKKHRIPYTTYLSHETGDRGINVDTLAQYARLLKVDFISLLK